MAAFEPDERLSAFLAGIKDMTPDKLVKLFIKTRETKSAAASAFKAQEAQFNAIMEACENALLAAADKAGVEGFKTELGTTYVGTEVKYSIADDTAFKAFLETQDDKYGFFERRISSTRMGEYMKQHEDVPPPGLNLFRTRVMRVRKV